MNDLTIYINEMPVFDSDRLRFFASFEPRTPKPVPAPIESGTFLTEAERRVALDELIAGIGNTIRGSVLEDW